MSGKPAIRRQVVIRLGARRLALFVVFLRRTKRKRRTATMGKGWADVPSLVIGYNVEWTRDRNVASQFLATARKVHEAADAPCTLYLVGGIIEAHRTELESLEKHPLFDLQMTMRKPLKSICQVAGGRTTVWRGASLEEIDHEVEATKSLFEEAFERAPTGLSSALGYYRGLQDRPDILEILYRHGIRFVRTYARDANDWQPVEFSVEPFSYVYQGFPGIVEFPSQGWQEAIIRKLYGWEEVQSYLEYAKADADEVARRENFVWSYWAHDWSVLQGTPEMEHIAGIVRYAREVGIEPVTQREAHRRFLAGEMERDEHGARATQPEQAT